LPGGTDKNHAKMGQSVFRPRVEQGISWTHDGETQSKSTEIVKYPAGRTNRIVGAQHEANEAATGAGKQETVIIFSKDIFTVSNATAPTFDYVH